MPDGDPGVGYQPSEEEIKRAEERMTGNDIRQSEKRELFYAKEKIQKELDELPKLFEDEERLKFGMAQTSLGNIVISAIEALGIEDYQNLGKSEIEKAPELTLAVMELEHIMLTASEARGTDDIDGLAHVPKAARFHALEAVSKVESEINKVAEKISEQETDDFTRLEKIRELYSLLRLLPRSSAAKMIC